MKKIIFLIFLSIIFMGCNMNANKEARLQQLETEIARTLEKIDKLEIRVQALENVNEQLESKIVELENTNNAER